MKYGKYIYGGILLGTVALVWALLGDDSMPVLSWWFAALLLTVGFYPLSARLFHCFTDHGFLFGKVLGSIGAAYVMFVLGTIRLVRFSGTGVWIAALIAVALVWGVFLLAGKKSALCGLWKELPWGEVLAREALFLITFAVFAYLKGYNPSAYGTERMMDYGFMKSIARMEYFPADDFWFSGEKLNYYYFGQYVMTYLTKLSGNEVVYGYNLALSMCFALCVSLSFSLVYQWMYAYMKDGEKQRPRRMASLAGTFAALAVTFAANCHYIIFNFLVPMCWEILNIQGEKPEYWFADSTRYIGYQPDVPDKTAHEYPAYSFLLGDLHAHVINIFVVMTILAVLFACTRAAVAGEKREWNWKKLLLDPHVLAIGFLIGICMMENYWDFPIYFVVSGAILLSLHLRSGDSVGAVAARTAVQGAMVVLVAVLTAIPFTIYFKAMTNGFALAETHTVWYQLLILWALPVSVLTGHFVSMAARNREKGFRPVLRGLESTELYVLLLGLCAAGLILIPEVVYVVDIYTGSYKRFNTMFKLSYQAFILLGLMMGFVLTRWIFRPQSAAQRKWGIVAGVIILWCCCYFKTALDDSFGDVTDKKRYKGLRADAYIYEYKPQDAEAIDWINASIPSGSVILEANGDSYTLYNCVSVLTGLPTVLGWHTHEWLWHNAVEPVDARAQDVRDIYLGYGNPEELLKKYNVDYIYIGSNEYEKYGADGIDVERLLALGDVVYYGSTPDWNGDYVYVVKVKQ